MRESTKTIFYEIHTTSLVLGGGILGKALWEAT